MHYNSSKQQAISSRVLDEAHYFVANNSTVRATALAFAVSKSTVHKDITERLKNISPSLYASVQKILKQNTLERAIRGGKATKRKYILQKK